MSNKHTPGPWIIERVPIQSRGGSNTCFKIGPFCACIYDDWRQYEERGITTNEIIANAKLIAAAPELLIACKELLSIYNKYANDNPEEDNTADFARDIIKKATE